MSDDRLEDTERCLADTAAIRDELFRALVYIHQLLSVAEKELKAKTARVEKLEEALRFYADDTNWIEAKGEHVFDQFVCYDLGKRAREALDDA